MGEGQPWKSESEGSEEAVHTFDDQKSVSELSKKGIQAEGQLGMGVRAQAGWGGGPQGKRVRTPRHGEVKPRQGEECHLSEGLPRMRGQSPNKK